MKKGGSHEAVLPFLNSFHKLLNTAPAERIVGIPPVPEATGADSLVGHVRDQPAVTRNPLILRVIAELKSFVKGIGVREKELESILQKFSFVDPRLVPSSS